jgi:deazaflavin-dependent oxidoreductase (nitroreductase family)
MVAQSDLPAGAPLLRLTTTDAASGQTRTTPLPYTRDGSRLIVDTGPEKSSPDPDWCRDLAANPMVTVEVGDEPFRAIAHLTNDDGVVVLERVLDRDTDYVAFNRPLIEEFRANGGKVGGMFAGLDLLLLTTTGAKSGRPRIAPLLYTNLDGRLVVVASKGGSPTHPDWYRNLLAHPDVTVELGTERFPVRATVAAGPERQRLLEMLLPRVPKLAETQASTTRQLPIVVLERAG